MVFEMGGKSDTLSDPKHHSGLSKDFQLLLFSTILRPWRQIMCATFVWLVVRDCILESVLQRLSSGKFALPGEPRDAFMHFGFKCE